MLLDDAHESVVVGTERTIPLQLRRQGLRQAQPLAQYAQEHDVEGWLEERFVPQMALVSNEITLNYIGEKVLELLRSY
jgi:hypothetical protein